MDTSHFVTPFIRWWTFGLFLLWGNYECYYQQQWVIFMWTYVLNFCVNICPQFPWVELLGHVITLCLTFRGTTKHFPKWRHHLTSPPAKYKGSDFSTSSSTFVTVTFFNTVILVGVKWYLGMVLICISLTASEVEHLFTCLLVIFFTECLWKSFARFSIGFFVFFIIEL